MNNNNVNKQKNGTETERKKKKSRRSRQLIYSLRKDIRFRIFIAQRLFRYNMNEVIFDGNHQHHHRS